ncbi:hypothetical protein CSC94_18760 [Zhengella mangrovi]|uniref:Uncharacterized protein n=1 Tax=Zhengella mangrovi TaxID=1982044 RepID=A0A2G1QIP7_9HYPH|nr:hypothetical protein [Zhengella mangrovi]PHP65403.1 hypothetical protein CSC94_18760 [Zhengella mangrovi]
MDPTKQTDWTWYQTRILDHELNVAAMMIANRLFPAGFDVAEDAPDTYEKLKALFESGKRYVVYSGGSDRTIFGDPEVNFHFRAWHDWCHWKGAHEFTVRGEYDTFRMQHCHLVAIYGDNAMTKRWRRILFADIVGQKLHEKRTGQFPEDQFSFVKACLEGGIHGASFGVPR